MKSGGVAGGLGAVGVLVATVFATLEPAQNWLCSNYNTFCPSSKASSTPGTLPSAAQPTEVSATAAPAPASHSQPATPPAPPHRAALPGEEAAWSAARATGSSAGYDNFLESFPNGRYAEDARQRKAEIEAQQAASRQRTGYSFKMSPSTPNYGPGEASSLEQTCRQWASTQSADTATASNDMMGAASGMIAGGALSGGQSSGQSGAGSTEAAYQRCMRRGGPG